MMNPTPREDHLASRPQPDGKVIIHTVDGEDHCHLTRWENGWSEGAIGITFRSDVGVRTTFPWTNIVSYEAYPNSDDFNQQFIGWLKDCDHEWLTHPAVGHYCKHCRLDMEDMPALLQNIMTEPPALVSTDPRVDREAAAHEGSPLPGVPSPPAPSVTIIDLGTICGCDMPGTEHDGPCKFKPETWPNPPEDY